MRLEVGRVNASLVRTPAYLSLLRAQAEPALETKDGGTHRFDKATLDRLFDALSPLTRASLRLPILLYLDHELPGECYVADPVAIEALVQLDAVRARPREGRLWMNLGAARGLVKAWPTVFQFVRL